MIRESSSKIYYRYLISDSEVFSEESRARKLKKATNHHASHLLIDLTRVAEIETGRFPGLTAEAGFTYSVLCKVSHLAALRKSNFVFSEFYVAIETKDHLLRFIQLADPEVAMILSPPTNLDLQELLFLLKEHESLNERAFWSFRPYDPKLKNSLTLKEIEFQQKEKNTFFKTLPGLEIWNSQIPDHHELAGLADLAFSFSTAVRSVQISVIIPSFNNITFLSNTLQHLFRQNLAPEKFEVIVVEDGGADGTVLILKSLFENYKHLINLKVIYWPKKHAQRGEQNFFRAGLARNLGMQFCESEMAVFLDSDILVPPDFLQVALTELEANDLIQFQRYHIQQKLSLLNPSYQTVKLHADTYTEEKNYWRQLFECDHWMALPDYWKYTCTYALGLRRSDFRAVGGFKKYYVSYGFEDTDLGYEFYKRHARFKLIKKPLLHLTAYDQQQYKNSSLRRLKLLRKTAALFYLQHLDSKVYTLFGNFYRFEKSIYHSLRDLF